jgi:phytoene synthase
MNRDESYAECRRLTRHHAKSFYFASHTLPRDKRAAAYAVYAYCRHVDDAIDLAPGPEEKRRAIVDLRGQLDRIFEDPAEGGERWIPAFVDTVRKQAIPRRYFEDLLKGVEMDQGRVRLETWQELRDYCYHVAAVVGLMMTHVLAPPREELLAPAIDLGIAMQLTNILRDVREDWERDRIYLPREEMERFGVAEEDLAQQRLGDPLRALLRFQIGRAREHYQRAEEGIRELPNDGSQLTVWLMRHIYAGILEEIERADYRIFDRRVHVSTARKFLLAFRAWRSCGRSCTGSAWKGAASKGGAS